MSTMSNISSNTSNTGNKNVVDTAAANGSFKTFGRALRQAGMADQLKAEGPFTLFAPTDAAFEQLYTELGVSGINEIPLSTLVAVLKHHVVSGRKFSADLSSGSVETLNGEVSVDTSANPPTITGQSGADNVASLQLSLLNIHATNGVIHVIDTVILPQ